MTLETSGFMPPNAGGLPSTPENQHARLPRWMQLGLVAGALAVATLVPSAGALRNTSPYYVDRGAYTQYVLQHNSARIGEDGCSAAVITDPDSAEDVGAISAVHCGFYDQAGLPGPDPIHSIPYIEGSDGQTYIVDDTVINTGKASNRMQPVGKATDVLVSSDGSTDEALIVFAGHTKEEVLRDYQSELLPEKEINRMVPGKSTFNVSGWPIDQLGDGHGNQLRQDFTATYIGRKVLTVLPGITMNTILAAFPENSNNATCSPGISGSGGFVVRQTPDNGTKEELVGVVSLNAHDIETEYPKINWKKYAALCALAPNTLQEGKLIDLHVVHSIDEIPTPQVRTYVAAMMMFYESRRPQTVADGVLVATTQQNTNGKTKTVRVTYDNPILYTNNDSSVTVGYYDNKTHDFATTYYPAGSHLDFYSHGNNGAPKLLETRRFRFNKPVPGRQPDGSFSSKAGYTFGIRDSYGEKVSGTPYRLAKSNGGNWQLVPER